MSELKEKTRAVFFAFPQGTPGPAMVEEIADMRQVAKESGVDCSVELDGDGIVIKIASMEDFDKLAEACGSPAEGYCLPEETIREYTRTYPDVFSAKWVSEIAQVIRDFAKTMGVNCTIETAGNNLTARADNGKDFAGVMAIIEAGIEPAVQKILSSLSEGQPVRKDILNTDYHPNI